MYCETPDYNTPIPVRNTEPSSRAASRKKLFDISNTPQINTPTTDTWCTPLWDTLHFSQESASNKEKNFTWNLNFDEQEILQEFIGLPGAHYSPISPAT